MLGMGQRLSLFYCISGLLLKQKRSSLGTSWRRRRTPISAQLSASTLKVGVASVLLAIALYTEIGVANTECTAQPVYSLPCLSPANYLF